MTLQLAVRITGNASDLVRASREGVGATQGMTSAVQATGRTAREAAAGMDRAAEAARDLAAAEREAAAAGKADAAAGRGSVPPRSPGASPATPPPPAPAPAPVVVPMPGRGPAPASPAQGAAAGLRPDQWKNLGFQANDIATSLASGIPITQVIAQQGGQVAQVLGDAPGGIAGGLKIVASRAMAILTPVRLVAGGFVGLAATVAALGVSWSKSQDDIEKGLTGIGAMSRATVGDINRIAEAASGGGLISTGQARGVATAIASTGKVDVSNIASVTALAPGYAQLMGKDLDEAGADLARIFSDPVKGADELNARIGGLDESTRQYIRTLVEQGRRQEAVQVLVRAFAPDIEAATQKTSAWAKAWTAVSTAAGGVGRLVAKPFRDDALDEQIIQARKKLSDLEFQRDEGTGFDAAGEIPAQKRLLADLEKQAADAAARPGRLVSAELSRQGDEAVRAIMPQIDAAEKLTNSIAILEKVEKDAAATAGLTANARAKQTSALEAARGALDSNLSEAEKARASEALTIRSIEARTVVEKAAIAAERERIALAGQAIAEDDRRQRIEAARKSVLAQSTRESQDRLRGANDNAASAGLPSYPRGRAEVEARFREILKGDEGNLPAIANDQKARAAELAALDKEAIGGPMREANRALAEQVSGLKLQQDAFGASTEAAERMAAALRLTNQYTSAGVPITAELKKEIDAVAAASGRVAGAQEDLLRRQREVLGGLDDVRSGLRGGVNGLFSDLAQGRNPLDNLASAAGGIAARIADRTVTAPLIGGLFGQEGKAGGGLFGDALGGLFGKAAGLSTAEISAGVVNLTGPVAGIPGLGGSGLGDAAATLGAGKAGEAASGILSGLTGSRADVAEYVKKAAVLRGIDPDVALRVVNQESGFNVAARNVTSKEASYGVMQLNTMGGLGTEALKAGIDPRDPSAWRSQVDFGLDVVKRDGWRQWYGAKDIGISRWEGIGKGGPIDAASIGAGAAPSAASVAGPLSSLENSLKSIGGTATASAKGVDSLAGNLTNLPVPLAQTSEGLDKVGSSLGSNGGGLVGLLTSLFSSGASAAAPAVAAAGGGHIRGPGTSTSDSIPAWLSDGEFVINAAATKKHLPLLQAINENRRMPAFAEGGIVGMAPPQAARAQERQRQREAAGPAAAGGPVVNVQVQNNAGAQVRTQASRGPDGQIDLKVLIDQQVASAMTRSGSSTNKTMQAAWGLQPQLTRRG